MRAAVGTLCWSAGDVRIVTHLGCNWASNCVSMVRPILTLPRCRTSLEKKLDTVGEAIDGEGQALHARRTEAPERGQMGLQQFMTQSRPGDAAPKQHWQPAGGKAGGAAAAAAAAAAGKSPGKTTQATLLNFFGGSRQLAGQQQQQQQQQGMPPGGPPPPPHGMQQQAQNAGPLPQHSSRPPVAHPQPGQAPLQPLHGPSGMANVQQQPAAPGKPAGVAPGGQQAQQQPLAGMKRPYGT